VSSAQRPVARATSPLSGGRRRRRKIGLGSAPASVESSGVTVTFALGRRLEALGPKRRAVQGGGESQVAPWPATEQAACRLGGRAMGSERSPGNSPRIATCPWQHTGRRRVFGVTRPCVRLVQVRKVSIRACEARAGCVRRCVGWVKTQTRAHGRCAYGPSERAVEQCALGECTWRSGLPFVLNRGSGTRVSRPDRSVARCKLSWCDPSGRTATQVRSIRWPAQFVSSSPCAARCIGSNETRRCHHLVRSLG
jgi:hypothetical protein